MKNRLSPSNLVARSAASARSLSALSPPCNKWLTLTPRLGLAILTASLFLGCSSAPVSETTGHPASTSTPDAQTKVQSRFQATAEAEPATTTSPLSVATPSSTLAPPAAPTPSPPATPAPVATSTPAPRPHTLPAIETPVLAGQEAIDVDMSPHARAHGTAFEASGEAAGPVDGRANSFDPGPRARGDDHGQARSIPEKRELKYPNLGSRLDELVARVEAAETTAEDAARDAAVHRGASVAVTIHLSGSVDGVVAFLEENGGDSRNVGEDYVEAYVPVTLLGPVSEQPGVLRVREIVTPERGQGG